MHALRRQMTIGWMTREKANFAGINQRLSERCGLFPKCAKIHLYVHLLFQKIFRGLYPRTPVNMGGEGKAREGREEREVEGTEEKISRGFAPAPPGKRKEGRGREGRG
jgi:hypothetical protein